MPFVDLQSSSGPLSMHYTISTPSNPSADAIDESLPTVLFLHAIYLGQQIYELQFKDPKLRRFNLVAIDSRGHGETSGPVPTTWSPTACAEDIYCFMQKLNIPPCHFVSMSMHTLSAAHFTVLYPEMVLSQFFISPVPDYEDEDVIAGRKEIYECWVQGFADPENVDEAAVQDAVYGALQLAFNNLDSPLMSTLWKTAIPPAIVQWGPGKLDAYWNTCISFFANSKAFTPEQIARMKGTPTKIIHGENDIAYPLELSERVVDLLTKEGVEAELVQILGATHYACITAANEINTMLYEWILKHTRSEIPPIPGEATSPWKEFLGDYEENEDSD